MLSVCVCACNCVVCWRQPVFRLRFATDNWLPWCPVSLSLCVCFVWWLWTGTMYNKIRIIKRRMRAWHWLTGCTHFTVTWQFSRAMRSFSSATVIPFQCAIGLNSVDNFLPFHCSTCVLYFTRYCVAFFFFFRYSGLTVEFDCRLVLFECLDTSLDVDRLLLITALLLCIWVCV